MAKRKKKKAASPAVEAAAEAAERRSKGLPLDDVGAKAKPKSALPPPEMSAAAAPAEEPASPSEARRRVDGRFATTYTQEAGDALCAYLACGGSLAAYCREPGSPGYSTVLDWLRTHEGFRTQYNAAREEQADALADELLDIADNEPDTNKARLRVDVRKWTAARMRPKKYGDRIESVVSGHDGGALKVDVTPQHPGHDHLADMAERFLTGLAKHNPTMAAVMSSAAAGAAKDAGGGKAAAKANGERGAKK